LIWEREFLNNGENVYKVGRTTQTPDNFIHRLKSYKKKSEIIHVQQCDPIHVVELETSIKRQFRKQFRTHTDGTEYFIGDRYDMIQCIYENITNSVDKKNKLQTESNAIRSEWDDNISKNDLIFICDRNINLRNDLIFIYKKKCPNLKCCQDINFNNLYTILNQDATIILRTYTRDELIKISKSYQININEIIPLTKFNIALHLLKIIYDLMDKYDYNQLETMYYEDNIDVDFSKYDYKAEKKYILAVHVMGLFLNLSRTKSIVIRIMKDLIVTGYH